MITSVFRKSTPLNFSMVVILMLVFFSIFQFQDLSFTNSTFSILNKVGLFCLLIISMFISSFIAKRNGLTRDSAFTIFFYLLFLLFFPSVLNNANLIIANFFILLAIRRLVSLQSLKTSKEKIFDASFCIFVAALFHFWSILFILLVFISIILHVARDYRNWILPFIALLSVLILFLIFTTYFDINSLELLFKGVQTNFEIDYFTNYYQNGAFSIFATIALFFIVSIFITLSSKPQLLHTSYKKIIASFFIGILVFVVSANKSSDLLIFTIAPLSILATTHIEMPQLKLNQELVFYSLIVCSMFAFFSQL
ncbi:hypothetical protein SAMN05444372_107158 [Flavobacterium micromati]|uniref:Uncharacterized protein n=1 Tax=Flavobacterium micromati TaxID=229205 RepID=A0A1M5L059_9FLAO|nr:DUF6427 family protein [Flavobacterium micromati]SHG58438.1 hypothetical protein SAMN05444372_107158 [Flavobacterium micromati]